MNRELKTALLFSISLHAIFALIAFMIKFQFLPVEALQKIKLIEFGLPENSTNEKYINSSSATSNSNPDAEGRKSNLIPKKVNLPHAIAQDEENIYLPEATEQAYNKLDWDDKIGVPTQKHEDNLSTENIISKQKTEENPLLASDSDYLQSLNSSLLENSGNESSYILEGDVSNRRIMKKIIPGYPENIQKNIQVKIRFEVLPDGSVTNMVVVQKADPTLEETSLQALAQWQFNALTQDIIEIGTITFIYELK